MTDRTSEFRRRVQAGVMESPGESWYGPLVSRRISHRLAGFLVRRTRLTADAVTAVMVCTGAAGALLFLARPGWPWLLGAALLHVWLVLDAVDGEVARGRGTTSAAGIYLDAAGHYAVNPGLLWALAMASRTWPAESRWILGFLAFAAHVWSKAAGDVALAVRHHLAEDRGNRRYGGTAPPEAGGGRAAGSGVLARARLASDAATPVAILTAVAVLSVAGGRWPAARDWAGEVAAAAACALTLVHAAKAAHLFRAHYLAFRRARPAGHGSGRP